MSRSNIKLKLLVGNEVFTRYFSPEFGVHFYSCRQEKAAEPMGSHVLLSACRTCSPSGPPAPVGPLCLAWVVPDPSVMGQGEVGAMEGGGVPGSGTCWVSGCQAVIPGSRASQHFPWLINSKEGP